MIAAPQRELNDDAKNMVSNSTGEGEVADSWTRADEEGDDKTYGWCRPTHPFSA